MKEKGGGVRGTDTLKPEYNILKMAGSSLGYKHSE